MKVLFSFKLFNLSLLTQSVVELISAAFILGLLISIGVSAIAQEYCQTQDGRYSYTCSNTTIKGAYEPLFESFQGTEAPFTPITAVRTSVFDGNGNFEGSGYFIVGENI